jgi:hypothetical protein
MPCLPWCLFAPPEWTHEPAGGQFACAKMYYGIFVTIVDLQIGGWGVFFGKEKGFHVGINTCSAVDFPPPSSKSQNIQHHDTKNPITPDR